jgi:hypothetical protein
MTGMLTMLAIVAFVLIGVMAILIPIAVIREGRRTGRPGLLLTRIMWAVTNESPRDDLPSASELEATRPRQKPEEPRPAVPPGWGFDPD